MLVLFVIVGAGTLFAIERTLAKEFHEIDPPEWVDMFRLWLRELWAAREDGRFQ